MMRLVQCGLLVMLAVVLLAAVPGCQSTPSNGSLDLALRDYEAGRYEDAHRNAVQAMRRHKGAERYRAAYLAGLSAHQQGDNDEAELRLLAASNAKDPAIAGQAKAMLGMIRMDQGRPADAARFFDQAAIDLSGDDRRMAADHAAHARAVASGRASESDWPAQRSFTTAERASGGFTLQVGAFREHYRALQAARAAEDVARSGGHGPVRVIESTDARGRKLYLVQFGRFETRSAAADARSRLGRLDFIVAARR